MTGIEGFDAAAEDMEMALGLNHDENEYCRTIKIRPNPPIIPLNETVKVNPLLTDETTGQE